MCKIKKDTGLLFRPPGPNRVPHCAREPPATVSIGRRRAKGATGGGASGANACTQKRASSNSGGGNASCVATTDIDRRAPQMRFRPIGAFLAARDGEARSIVGPDREEGGVSRGRRRSDEGGGRGVRQVFFSSRLASNETISKEGGLPPRDLVPALPLEVSPPRTHHEDCLLSLEGEEGGRRGRKGEEGGGVVRVFRFPGKKCEVRTTGLLLFFAKNFFFFFETSRT